MGLLREGWGRGLSYYLNPAMIAQKQLRCWFYCRWIKGYSFN